MITGRIVKAEESKDGRQNIAITVEFSEDGVVIVPSWTLWAQYANFLGMTVEEISEWIRINVEHQIGNLIQERSKTVINDEFIKAIELMKTEKIFQTDKVQIEMTPSLVLAEGYTVTLNADGTYTTNRIAKEHK